MCTPGLTWCITATSASSNTTGWSLLVQILSPSSWLSKVWTNCASTLMVISGFSELLLEESYGSLNPQQKKILFNVVVAAREVRDILRDTNEDLIPD